MGEATKKSVGDTVLELRGVTKSYESGLAEPTPVLNGIDLSVTAAETLAVIGPSGSGKSTLLNIMGALDKPTAGDVRIDGRDMLSLGDKALSELRNSRIGFVFQLHHLLPQCSILENVLIPTLVHPDPGDAAERAARLLERVGLSHRIAHRPGQLSGGERQRVAVVRALINDPPLLLADEPTGSLDRARSADLCSLLLELNKEDGVTIVMVTHSERLAGVFGRVLELRDGRLGSAG